LRTRSAVIGSPEQQLTTEHAKGCWTLPANSRKEPTRQERKHGVDLAHIWGAASLRRSTRPAPSWTAKPTSEIAEERAVTEPGEKYPSPALIVLFGAVGAIVPIVLLLLDRAEAPDLFGFALLVWPTSIFMTGVHQSAAHLTASAFLLPVLANVAIYLVFGSLLWLGLVRPRSIVYLTIVGLMYLTIVGFAGFCELLLGSSFS